VGSFVRSKIAGYGMGAVRSTRKIFVIGAADGQTNVVVMDTEYGRGVGRTKKEAELKAAAAAWTALSASNVDA